MPLRTRRLPALLALLAATPFLIAQVELPPSQVPDKQGPPVDTKLPQLPPQLTGIGAPACLADGAVFPAQGVNLAGADVSCRTDCPGVKIAPGTGPDKTPACVIKGHPDAGAACTVEMRLGKTKRTRKVKTCPARWRVTLDAPARVEPGERVRLTVRVRNEGDGKDAYRGEAYLRSDAAKRQALEPLSHRGLAPGQSASHVVSIARAPAAGDYALCAVIGGAKAECRPFEVVAGKTAGAGEAKAEKGAAEEMEAAPGPGPDLAREALPGGPGGPGGLGAPAAEALGTEALGEKAQQIREFRKRIGTARFPLVSENLLQINGDWGPTVNVAEGDTVEASWARSRAFVEGIGEELRRHWLVVSESALAEDSCVVADEDALPDADTIDGDGRHGASTFSRELRGLAPGTSYYVKVCLQTRRPGASPEDAWRHESQQIRLDYGEGAFGGEEEGGWIGLLEPPSAEDLLRVTATAREEAPDLVVKAISLSRDPGGGAGQLLIQFKDLRGERHFRGYYDAQRSARRRAGQPSDPEDIYPFGYEVFVDGMRVPHAAGRSYLPPSAQQHVVTERYWLPGDGRAHEVRVVATPVFVDHDTSNNARTATLTAETQTEPRFSVTGDATGSAFRIPGELPFLTRLPDYYTKVIAAPGIDIGGYYYGAPTTRGPFGPGACVNSRGVTVMIGGTAGSTRLTRLGVEVVGTSLRQEVELSGRRWIDGAWHESGAPYGYIDRTFSFDMQDLIRPDHRPVAVRGWVEDASGRVHSEDLRFVLAGYQFTPDSDMVSLSVDRVLDHDTGEWSTASRGATDVTIDGERESLVLNGRVRLNPDNCALRDTRVRHLQIALNPVDRPDHFGATIGISNVYRIRTSGLETTFEADYNIRNGLTEPAGRYELLLSIWYTNLVRCTPARLPNYSASPPMRVTVER